MRPTHSAAAIPSANTPEASLNLLMSLFAVKPSVWLAQAVVCQLESLAGNTVLHGGRRDRYRNYRDLLPAWQGIVRRLRAIAVVQGTLLDSDGAIS